MRNLRVAIVDSRQLDISAEGNDGREAQFRVAAFDAYRNRLVFATSSGSLVCISASSAETFWILPLHMALDRDRILCLDFMMDNEVLAIGTQSGQLLAVSLSSQSFEVVGNVEGGIVQMSSSPDGELLAVATGLGMLLLMTAEWDVLYEIPLTRNEARSVEEGGDSFCSAASNLQIRWRSDGKFFATLCNSASLNHGKELHIWERDTGTLHSSSKTFLSTSSALDWISSGSRLASSSNLGPDLKASRVVFFERNGLERGYFDIEGMEDILIACVKWNCNGELFAVLLQCNEYDAIQIWSFSNYHWYLKQEWRYPKESETSFLWSEEDPMYMMTWTVTGHVRLIRLCWDNAITKNHTALVINGPYVLVTPLAIALIPPPMCFLKLKFHAPVQAVSLHSSENGDILISASLSNGMVSLLLLPNMGKWDDLEDSVLTIPHAKCVGLDDLFPSFRILTWIDSEHLFGIISKSIPKNSRNPWCPNSHRHTDAEMMVEFEIRRENKQSATTSLVESDWILTLVNKTCSEKRILAIARHPLESTILIEYEDGTISTYGGCKEGLSQNEMLHILKRLSYPSFWIEAVTNDSLNTVIIALDNVGRLQIGTYEISPDCTNFAIHSTCVSSKRVIHVLYITRKDVLNVVDLSEVHESHEITRDLSNLCSQNKGEPNTFRNLCRKRVNENFLKLQTVWERGARLVAAIGGTGTAVILQTVRGNLETIYPRNLVIGSIVASLCDSKFNDALLLARRHHVNLNLIVDFKGWKEFVNCAAEFVMQVKILNHVTELVCAVSAGNCDDSPYQDVLLSYMKRIGDLYVGPADESEKPNDSQPNNLNDQSLKVRSVMHAIRKALQDVVPTSPKRELCILTTMARSDPPELQEALKRIKNLREEELNCIIQGVEQSTERCIAEDALKHLLWLSDSESLFNAALGLYDLHLAAMVAANAQWDPKEFLPLLQGLEQMPAPIMKYTIDLKLERFENALRNLASAGNSHFNECLELIRKHPKLFAVGKEIFKDGSEKMSILEAWGDHLFSEEKFEEAAAAFSSCSQLQKALTAYRAGGLWQCALVVGSLLGFPPKDILALAQELRDELQALGRPGDAAKIALEYCKDPDDALQLFIEAREWMEAMKVAYCYNKENLVKDVIESAALDSAASYMSEFEEGLEKLGKYVARYIAVKQRRQMLEMKFKMDLPEKREDDAASDVSSHVSDMSAYTTGSTKSSKYSVKTNQKHSRTKSRSGKIRAGSPGEEAALVEHIKGMNLSGVTVEAVQKLIQILLLLGHYSVAEKLQHVAFQFQTSHQKAVIEVDESCKTEGK